MRQWLFWVSQTKLSWEIFWRPHCCRFPAVFWVGTEFFWEGGEGSEKKKRSCWWKDKPRENRQLDLLLWSHPFGKKKVLLEVKSPLCREWVSREWRKVSQTWFEWKNIPKGKEKKHKCVWSRPAKETIFWTWCTSEKKVIEKDGNCDFADLSRFFTFTRLRKVLNIWHYLTIKTLLFLPRPVFGSGDCEPIGIPMCQVLHNNNNNNNNNMPGIYHHLHCHSNIFFKNIGYNFTRLPNQFNHETQEEVTDWYLLIVRFVEPLTTGCATFFLKMPDDHNVAIFSHRIC